MITDRCPTCGRDDPPQCGTCRHWRGHASMLDWGDCVRPLGGVSCALTQDWEYCSNHALREEATVES